MTVHALLLKRDTAAGGLIAAAALSSACFGAAVGTYTGRWQIVTDALKMPVYLLGTLAISFAAMHLFAARELRARETFAVAIETVALNAVVLGALAPIVWLLSMSLPVSPGLRSPESQRGYRILILLLTGSVAAGGVTGVARLYSRLRQASGGKALRLTALWIVLYQFVGAQMAWLLKPWVSHTGTDDRFLPLRDNLQGNFYESVWRTVLGLFS
ncbi:MAG: hypothetical protein JO332_14260 [Planctomycetaceae bacterium]|nr:hypothetical protein [Planctomycetaceae bacterium]